MLVDKINDVHKYNQEYKYTCKTNSQNEESDFLKDNMISKIESHRVKNEFKNDKTIPRIKCKMNHYFFFQFDKNKYENNENNKFYPIRCEMTTDCY